MLDSATTFAVDTSCLDSSRPRDCLVAARYNFLPDSLELGRGSQLQLSLAGEANITFTSKAGHEHHYGGNQLKAGANEYILIVDEDSKVARIEKLSSSLNVRNVRRSRRLSSGHEKLQAQHVLRSPANASSASSRLRSEQDDLSQLEAEIFGDFN